MFCRLLCRMMLSLVCCLWLRTPSCLSRTLMTNVSSRTGEMSMTSSFPWQSLLASRFVTSMRLLQSQRSSMPCLGFLLCISSIIILTLTIIVIISFIFIAIIILLIIFVIIIFITIFTIIIIIINIMIIVYIIVTIHRRKSFCMVVYHLLCLPSCSWVKLCSAKILNVIVNMVISISL